MGKENQKKKKKRKEENELEFMYIRERNKCLFIYTFFKKNHTIIKDTYISKTFFLDITLLF